MHKKILLTGGAGFIGKNILEYLGEKYHFISPSAQELDLTNTKAVYDFLKKEPVDVVIHAANIGGMRGKEELPDAMLNNLKMFFNLVRAKPFYKKMIVLGSGAEYGRGLPIAKINEKNFDARVPEDQYGFYKYICSKYAETTNFITHLRLFGVYGKYEDYQTRFISNAICRCLLGLPITIENQNVYFDYLYVKDFMSILEYFILKKAAHAVYNVGKGERVDLLTMAKTIKKVSGKPINIVVKNKGMGMEYTCDTSRLNQEVKPLTFTSHLAAVKELYQWYQKRQATITLNKSHGK